MESLVRLMTDLVEDLEPKFSTFALPPQLENMNRVATLTTVIDFFVHLCNSLYPREFLRAQTMPLSLGEDLRIRRALLRFHLYAQLFHQPESTDELVSDRDWEQRHQQQQYFWTKFTTVEVEECKCIYALLVDALSYMRPFQSSTPCFTKSSQRGLPLLDSIFFNSGVTPLASSYAERLVDYAFTGLDKMDPHDGNYFLPYRDFQNEVLPRERRFKPSEAHREGNFFIKCTLVL